MSRVRRSRFFLSSPPTKVWPDAVMFHGVRVGVGLILAAAIVALFPASPGVNVGRYQQGVVAERDLIAEIPFSVMKDAELLLAERDAAAARVIPTFRFRPQIADSVVAGISRFFTQLDSASEMGGTAGIGDVLARNGVEASAAQVQLLADQGAARRLLTDGAEAVQRLFPDGVIDPGLASEITADSVRIIRGATETMVPRENVLSGRDFYDRALAGRESGDEAELLRSILARFAEPNLSLDAGRTDADRRRARAEISGVIQNVLQGEAIVRANQQVGPDEIAKLDAYRSQLRNEGLEVDGSDLKGALGGLLLNTLLLAIMGLLLLFFRKPIYQDLRAFLLLSGLLLVFFLAGALIDRQGIPPQALPIAFVTIAVAILWDGRLALLMTFVVVALTAVQQPFADVDLVVTLLVGGAAAALSVRAFRRLAQAWVFIAVTAAAFAAAIVGLGLRSDEFLLVEPLSATAVSTVVGVILAVGFIPVFEWFAGVTTEQTLLGWADPNRTLLRRLATEAPGTWAHTLQVANLAETCANAIGANALLCRVGMLYHDVGKMLKPDHFIENQHGTNPHDALDPRTSADIIVEHVVEGLKMVRAENVPRVLEGFVAEHHGDQILNYFYQKALAEAEEEGRTAPDPKDYRYPGPRPQSRETAIAMLADAAESATRALQDPTASRIGDLIDGIFEARIRDGQLEDSSLTLGELRVLRDQLRNTLSSIHHQRIDYPETKHLTTRSSGDRSRDPSPESSPVSTDPPGAPSTKAPAHSSGEGDGP